MITMDTTSGEMRQKNTVMTILMFDKGCRLGERQSCIYKNQFVYGIKPWTENLDVRQKQY